MTICCFRAQLDLKIKMLNLFKCLADNYRNDLDVLFKAKKTVTTWR